MIKFFKRLFQILAGLVLLTMVTMLGIFTFVNPNQFKGMIEQQAQALTGHTLTIQGPLSWQWSPMLSLELQNVHFESPAPHQNKFFSAKSIQIDLGMGSFVSGKLLLNLKLNDLDLRLNRYKNASSNWETLIQNIGKSKPNEEATNKKSSAIMLSGIEIIEGQVIFADETNNNHYKIEHLGLKAQNLVKGAVGISEPIALSLQLEKNKQKLGKLMLTCDWALKYLDNQLNIQNALLQFESSKGSITSLSGSINVKNLNQSPIVLGKLDSKNIDINALLNDLQISNASNVPNIDSLQTNFEYRAPYLNINGLNVALKDNGNLNANLKIDVTKLSPQMLSLDGDFQGKKLVFGKIKIDDASGVINAKNGLININPMTLQIAESQQQATISIDLKSTEPKFVLTQEGKGFEIKQFLAMFDIKNKIEGKTYLKLTLSARGNNLESLQRTLSGQTKLEIKDGKFYGIDLITLLKDTQSGLHNLLMNLTGKQKFNLDSNIALTKDIWEKKPSETSITPFDSILATITFTNGLAQNTDLAISHSEYKINGSGSVNLVDGATQYHSTVLLNKNPYPANDEIGNYLYKTPLPIKITGPITSPKIQPDIKTYTNNAVSYAQQKVARDLIQKTATKTVEKILHKAVDKELGDTIDKTLNQFLKKVQK